MARVTEILCRYGAMILAVGSNPPALGQNLPPPETAEVAMTHLTAASNSGNNATANEPGGGPPAPTILGSRLPFELGLTVQGYYDDNIYSRPDGNSRKGDFIYSLAPWVAWNSAYGRSADVTMQVAYAPTIVFYQDHSSNDTVDQAATAIFGYEGDRESLILSQSYSDAQETTADFNRLIRETNSTTAAQLTYQVGEKTDFEWTARQTFTGDHPGFRSMEWTLSDYFDYQATPKTYLGLGNVLGAVELQGPNQTYEQLNGRFGYNPDAKLSLSTTTGAEMRQTQGHAGSRVTPDFSIGGEYEPSAGTDFGLNAYRRYDYSGRFYGDDYLATGASASVSQRMGDRFHLSLAATFEDAQYFNNFRDAEGPQAYDYIAVRPSVAYQLRSNFRFELFYQYRQSLAEGGVAAFTDNQAGFSAQFNY